MPMARIVACCVAAAALLMPVAYAKKPQVSIDEVRQAVQVHWSGVRDISVRDRASYMEYRHIPLLALPKDSKASVTPEPNVWKAAPGLEYLELWQGGKQVKVTFDGSATCWQGQRTAFRAPEGRIRAGHDVPFEDIGFSYYVGRFGRFAGLADFLGLPTTRVTKAHARVDEIDCVRVEGPCAMNLEGTEKTYDVRLELAPQYGWLPVRARFSEAETGFTVREYRVRSFFNLDTFPFPREAQLNIYQVGQSERTNARPRSVLSSSLVYYVESVAVNQGLGPGDFVFEFEPGTRIHDERNGQVYQVPAAAPEPEPAP